MPASHIVIDGDGHICEPEIVWTEYTQAKFRDRVLQVRTVEGRSHLYLEGHLRSVGGRAGPAQACIPGGMSPEGQSLTWSDILPGSYDPKRASKCSIRKESIRHSSFPRSISCTATFGTRRSPPRLVAPTTIG